MRTTWILLVAVACSNEPMVRTRSPAKPAALSTVLLEDVPHVAQKPDFCGEACVAMWLGKLGKPGDQDWVFDQSGVDPRLGRGLVSRELAQTLKTIGFDTGPVWHHVAAGDGPAIADEVGAGGPDPAPPVGGAARARSRPSIDDLFAELHGDLARGVPSIVCMHSHDGEDATEHFRLVLGYDAATDEVVYHEPAEAKAAYRRMDRALFLRLWPLHYDEDRWTVIRFRLEARDVRGGRPAAAGQHTDADYAQKVLALRDRLPRGFHVEISRPFVVIGDSDPGSVRRWADHTVAWAVDKLKRDYFTRDPERILEVWLFKDDASYRKHTRELFGDNPDTPYGYYSPAHGALIMNIATGGGTLVHEIVHPFIEANFPDAPPWLNEGLGSLYEQSSERNGRIVGLTNWRLAGLQTAIRRGELPPFETMTGADEAAFYGGAHSDTSYAQARYLLYYLQEQGKLVDFYKKFHAARAKDPTGFETLKQVLGVKDMAAFQDAWEEWVLGLEFDG